MNRKFEYSKHIMLWKHMAKEEVIKHIVSKTKADMNLAKDHTHYEQYTNFNIAEEKRMYIYAIFREYVANNCYACNVNTPCSACPIKIGRCSDGLYTRYIDAIASYVKTNSNIFLDKAIQYALDIAHAELNREVIEYHNIEVC